MKSCPNCASDVGEAAKVCPFCRYGFRTGFTTTKRLILIVLVGFVVVAYFMYPRLVKNAENEMDACLRTHSVTYCANK